MPYVKQEDRDQVDRAIDNLVAQMRDFTEDEIEGILNYSITRLLNEAMTKDGHWRYKKINRAVGVLECLKMEFYRRLAAPYENAAIRKNNDLPCYGNAPFVSDDPNEQKRQYYMDQNP